MTKPIRFSIALIAIQLIILVVQTSVCVRATECSKYADLQARLTILKADVDNLHDQATDRNEKAELWAIQHYLKQCVKDAEDLATERDGE